MGTKKVLIDPALNAAIWGKGIKNVAHRIRVRLQSELLVLDWNGKVGEEEGNEMKELLRRKLNADFICLLFCLGRRDDDEDAVEKLYTLATYVPTTDFKVSFNFESILFTKVKILNYLFIFSRDSKPLLSTLKKLKQLYSFKN